MKVASEIQIQRLDENIDGWMQIFMILKGAFDPSAALRNSIKYR